MFADLRLQGVHGVCITVLSVRRAADLVMSALAPTCDPLSASPRDIWHPVVDCAELRDKQTDSLGRCTAQRRACRQDSSALEEEFASADGAAEILEAISAKLSAIRANGAAMCCVPH